MIKASPFQWGDGMLERVEAMLLALAPSLEEWASAHKLRLFFIKSDHRDTPPACTYTTSEILKIAVAVVYGYYCIVGIDLC